MHVPAGKDDRLICWIMMVSLEAREMSSRGPSSIPSSNSRRWKPPPSISPRRRGDGPVRQRQIRQSASGTKSSAEHGDIVHGTSSISNVQPRYDPGDKRNKPRPG